MPSPPNGPARSHRRRTNALRLACEVKSRGVIAATKMSFFEPCALRISAIRISVVHVLGPGVLRSGAEGVLPGSVGPGGGTGQRGADRAERRVRGEAHPLGVVPQ